MLSIQFIFTDDEFTESTINTFANGSILTAENFTLEVSGSSIVDFSNYVNSTNGNELSISTMSLSSGEILHTIFGGTLEPIGDLLYEYTPPEGYPSDFILFQANDGESQSDLVFGTFSLNNDTWSSSLPPDWRHAGCA